MELLKVAKDIFETISDEISDQEALKFVADWSVSKQILSLTLNKNFEFLQPIDWIISKPFDKIILWTH